MVRRFLRVVTPVMIAWAPLIVRAVEAATVGRPPNRWERLLLEDFLPLVVLYILLTVPTWVASVLARSKSWWAGGIIGVLLGWAGGRILSSIAISFWGAAFLGIAGLIFDHTISNHYQERRREFRHPAWWAGGRIAGHFERDWKELHHARMSE